MEDPEDREFFIVSKTEEPPGVVSYIIQWGEYRSTWSADTTNLYVSQTLGWFNKEREPLSEYWVDVASNKARSLIEHDIRSLKIDRIWNE